MLHYEESRFISVSPSDVFGYIDDHSRFSSHMSQSSLMLGGGRMEVSLDDKLGKEVGSHILLNGKVFGIPVFLDEIVVKREAPFLKTWETVGSPKLLVIGRYRMEIKIGPEEQGSRLCVSIDYELPDKNRWLGKLFGGIYAKWCVGQMIKGVLSHFKQ